MGMVLIDVSIWISKKWHVNLWFKDAVFLAMAGRSKRVVPLHPRWIVPLGILTSATENEKKKTHIMVSWIEVPQNGWFIMEIPSKVDDLGVPLF